MISLRDNVAVITGASSGIGKAIAAGLIQQGVFLCLIGRNILPLKDMAAAGVPSSRWRAYRADLASVEDVLRAAEGIRNDFGQIDILIHSAGYFSMGEINQASPEEFDSHYTINVRAPYVLTQSLLPAIRPQGGQIVFINSSAGLKAKAKVCQYAASKHALKAFADSLREEVNADGIRVLSVFPGRTATPMQEAVHRFEGRAYDAPRFMQPEDVAAVIVNALMLPWTAEITDINIRPMNKNSS